MKHFVTLVDFLRAQSQKQLWLSTCCLIVCIFGVWYIVFYKPLLTATDNFKERLAQCSQACDLGEKKQTSFKELEAEYKKTVALLQEYKSDKDPQTFYHAAVDTLMHTLRTAQCSLLSFSSGAVTEQPLYQVYHATVVCEGMKDAVIHCLEKLTVSAAPWRITSLTIETGRDSLYHLNLGLDCLVLA